MSSFGIDYFDLGTLVTILGEVMILIPIVIFSTVTVAWSAGTLVSH